MITAWGSLPPNFIHFHERMAHTDELETYTTRHKPYDRICG